ncbi:MAG: prefoldin subunit alpha [Candidatus Micrarchaeota archaeon]
MIEDDEEGLNRLAQEIQNYQQQGQFVQQQLSSIQATLNEIAAAEGTIKGIKTVNDEEVLVPLGAGAHMQAKIVNPDKILINIGADVIAEKPIKEAIEILGERRKRLELTHDKLQESISEISNKLQQLDANAKKILAKKGMRQ